MDTYNVTLKDDAGCIRLYELEAESFDDALAGIEHIRRTIRNQEGRKTEILGCVNKTQLIKDF